MADATLLVDARQSLEWATALHRRMLRNVEEGMFPDTMAQATLAIRDMAECVNGLLEDRANETPDSS
jgi:hypothetical protein